MFPTEAGVFSSWDATSCVTNASLIRVGVGVMVASGVEVTTGDGVGVLVIRLCGIGDESGSIPLAGVGV